MTRDAAEIARLSAEAMLAEDKASRALGMKIEQVAPGLGDAVHDVGADMVNGHGLCHGGYIFTLANSAPGLRLRARTTSAPWPSTARSPT